MHLLILFAIGKKGSIIILTSDIYKDLRHYCDDCKFSYRQIRANNVDSDQTAPEEAGPTLFLISSASLDALLYGKTMLFKL